MIPLATSVLERAGETIGEYLPSIAGALAILVFGLVVARFVRRGLARLLAGLGVDRLAERLGIDALLRRAGLEPSLSRVIALVVYLALAVAVVLAAVSLLGLDALDDAINQAVLFLPSLIAALALALAGAVLGSLARERVERLAYQMDLRGPLGPVVQWAVIAVFLIIALGQLGVPTTILTLLAGVVAAGVALTLALAFGLGGRELAREVSAGRYVGSTFHVGQEITVSGRRGEIVAIESAATVLELDSGDRHYVPNHMFLEGGVTVHQTGD
ncbi:MAG: mechanosensitive ion channel family protein [Solirubrobacterales bacterium]